MYNICSNSSIERKKKKKLIKTRLKQVSHIFTYFEKDILKITSIFILG